jgi:hypothetical protein
MWCTGHLSAIGLQKLANAARLDGIDSPRMLDSAKLGTWGQHKSNVHRDLMTLLGTDVQLPTPLSVRVPCLDNKKNPPFSHHEMPILLPHVLIAKLAAHYPEQYQALFCSQSAKRFWKQVNPDDPRLSGPLSSTDRTSIVPLWMHGDGVEFSTDSLLAFSFGSVLCKSSSLDASMLIAAWPKGATTDKRTHPEHTWDEVFHIIAWSFTALWEGVHPRADWNGKPLKDGLAGKPLVPQRTRFCLWKLLGDLEYYANVLNRPHWPRAEFCWLCDCSKTAPDKSHKDVTDKPGWSLLTVPDMLRAPASTHPFFSEIPGPAANLRPAIDVLHTVDLGYAASLCGSVLHCWSFPDGVRARDAPLLLATVWGSIQAAYAKLQTTEKLSNLVLSMFCSVSNPWSTPPDLKAHAAEIRHLVPALALVAKQRVDASSTSGHCAAALEYLARFYLECEGQGIFMSRESAEAAEKKTCESLCNTTHGSMFTSAILLVFLYARRPIGVITLVSSPSTRTPALSGLLKMKIGLAALF